LRNRREALNYLIHLQAKVGNRPVNIDNYIMLENAIIEAYKKGEVQFGSLDSYMDYSAQIRELFNELPTQYEDPLYYMELKNCFDYFRNIIKTHNIENISEEIPLFGTLDLNFFSASIRKFNFEPIIVFSTTAVLFCDNISRVIAKMLGNSKLLSIQQVFENVIQNPEIIRGFLELFYSYLNGSIKTNQSYRKIKLDSQESFSCSLIKRYILTYIVAHEYSHLLLGHLNKNNTESLNISGEKIDFFSNSWSQEFEADMKACQIILHDTSDTNRLIMGITLFFDILFILDEFEKLYLLENKKAVFNTHPPARERAYKIKTEISKINPNPVKLISTCTQILIDNLVAFDRSLSNYSSTDYNDIIEIIYNKYSPFVENSLL